jgi:hypothetical protein
VITWVAWFIAWLCLGFGLFQSVTKAARKSHSVSPGSGITFGWILFSAGAAEITRYYLTIAPFPPFVWVVAGLGVVIIGALGGLTTGWFIGGRSFGRTADMSVGILGASITAWAQITSSYSHFDCAMALVLIGPVFTTLALRLYARAKTPQSRAILS